MQWTIRPFTRDLYGKTHGIIGMGNIGKETAIRSTVFGTELLYYSSRRLPEAEEKRLKAAYASLEELLERSDIVSIHTPLTPQTKGLINHQRLALMKPGSILINVARGGVVDEAALYKALCEGRLAGAGIDVWEEEPINPAVNKLLRLPQVIATSHVGAGTMDSFYRVFDMGFANISAVLNGAEPRYVVPVIN
jgi:D-3-phosphoglycerate dehydrogenase